MKKLFIVLLVIILSIYPEYQQEITICHSLYGSVTIHESVLIDLINCPTMQRLKNIHQYGVSYYALKRQPYSRYDHSIGVLLLLRRFNAPLHEQIAGLLHDASHTVFSHVGDIIFKHQSTKSSYQDDKHLWYLQQTEVPQILSLYNIALEKISHKNVSFKALEQDLPNLCADRLEYNLYGGFLEKLFSHEEVTELLHDLTFKNNAWFFSSAESARKIGYCSLYLTEHVFGAPWDAIVNRWGAQAITHALQQALLSNHDIHFATDDQVWHTLITNNDPIIQQLIKKIMHCSQHFMLSTEKEYHIHVQPKFRGINPLVQTEDGLKQLTDLDQEFSHAFAEAQQKCRKGFFLLVS